jgi:hypothetical protein
MSGHLHDTDCTDMAEICLVDRLRKQIENEAQSYSVNFEYVTPLCVYRAWSQCPQTQTLQRIWRK